MIAVRELTTVCPSDQTELFFLLRLATSTVYRRASPFLSSRTIQVSGMHGTTPTQTPPQLPLKTWHPSTPFTRSERPRILLRIPTPQENRWTLTPDSSWGNVLTTSYIVHRFIPCAHPELPFWNRYRATSCSLDTSLENLFHFLIISGLKQLSPFAYLKGSWETSMNLLILKSLLQLPIRLLGTGRRVPSWIHRSRFPRYPTSRPTLLRD